MTISPHQPGPDYPISRTSAQVAPGTERRIDVSAAPGSVEVAALGTTSAALHYAKEIYNLKLQVESLTARCNVLEILQIRSMKPLPHEKRTRIIIHD